MQSGSIAVRHEWVGLILFLAGCFIVAGLGSIATTPEIPNWYARLRKPVWTPPNWLFGPVWAALYAAMAVAAWMVWKRAGWDAGKGALVLFFIQLLLNMVWSFVFFRFHSPGWAFAEIILLWAAIAATALSFARVSLTAALLFVPYLLWVTYAAALNFAVWRMNR